MLTAYLLLAGLISATYSQLVYLACWQARFSAHLPLLFITCTFLLTLSAVVIVFIGPFIFHLALCASQSAKYVTTHTILHTIRHLSVFADLAYCLIRITAHLAIDRATTALAIARVRAQATYVSVLASSKAAYVKVLAVRHLTAISIKDFLTRLVDRSVSLIAASILLCGRRIITLFLTLLLSCIRPLRLLSSVSLRVSARVLVLATPTALHVVRLTWITLATPLRIILCHITGPIVCLASRILSLAFVYILSTSFRLACLVTPSVTPILLRCAIYVVVPGLLCLLRLSCVILSALSKGMFIGLQMYLQYMLQPNDSCDTSIRFRTLCPSSCRPLALAERSQRISDQIVCHTSPETLRLDCSISSSTVTSMTADETLCDIPAQCDITLETFEHKLSI
ncbi:hypothetical protein BD309DRAFT_777298 [Dichomitus squalens]|uniref:Uncharacterized protein n=1 Tax=Dichomitus squalens TaxID=114155 RepID=A0A4Q9MAX9_9APHY|nr:hypothetical protein BD311DRAFT_781026 [Dichomitus squalens]TBU44633.1 hypothetical protein BD309DRAFT_777298 [Dichomitus squalens]